MKKFDHSALVDSLKVEAEEQHGGNNSAGTVEDVLNQAARPSLEPIQIAMSSLNL